MNNNDQYFNVAVKCCEMVKSQVTRTLSRMWSQAFERKLCSFHFGISIFPGATDASEEPNASNEPPPATESVWSRDWHIGDTGEIGQRFEAKENQQISRSPWSISDVLGCVGKLKQLKLSVIRQDTSTIKYHMSHIQVEEVRWASTRLCRLRAVKAWVSNTKQMKGKRACQKNIGRQGNQHRRYPRTYRLGHEVWQATCRQRTRAG